MREDKTFARVTMFIAVVLFMTFLLTTETIWYLQFGKVASGDVYVTVFHILFGYGMCWGINEYTKQQKDDR